MDTLKLFSCRDCGTQVAWRQTTTGKRYLAQPKHWNGERFSSQRTYWPAHRCTPDPTWREHADRAEAERIALAVAAGRIERGCAVRVAKGRKFAIGTVGVVFWVADELTGYGITKCGVMTDGGEKIYINIENLELITEQETAK